nr:NADPH-cytochrome-P450 oxidoreductase [Tanacetum cinerariifolium]
MNDYPTRQLAQEQNLLVIVSTHGEGEPPMSAEELHTFINGPRAPKLPKLRYAVFALGDKSYLQYCQTGKDFDQKLADLGGTRLLDRVDADVAYKAPAAKWVEDVLNALTGANSTAEAPAATASAAVVAEVVTEYTAENPWPAKVLESIQLNGRGSDKETYHIELDLAGSGLHYAPGDALAVVPANHLPLVEEVLLAARLSDTTAKHGVCSSFLADRVAVGDTARVYVQQNEYFRLPQNGETDIIMIGAGTGIAPFRAFVEERTELGSAGRNWLLFGNPHFTTDFLYQAEWLQHL